jgi:threonine/homoserine/homoserine lactone efflux protein
MDSTISGATILTGLVLGWSVAWPPGPVNAELIRRCVLPRSQGGGFVPALNIALGACVCDFLWALAVFAGVGAVMNRPSVRVSLGVISFALLLFLAAKFAHNAWRIARQHQAQQSEGLSAAAPPAKRGRTFLLGFIFVLTSPWSMGFWLAVAGTRSGTSNGTFVASVVLALAVVVGAFAFACFLCTAVKLGARIFSRPGWQIATQG